MKFQGELPPVRNRRGGPGWWMDGEGIWRAPEEWPEDYPPLAGWERDPEGGWREPSPEARRRRADTRWTRVTDVEPEEPPRPSRQARADKRDMLIVTGVIGGLLVLLVAALVIINQAGAADPGVPPPSSIPGVIYPAEPAGDGLAEMRAAAAAAPGLARDRLGALPSATDVPADGPAFAADSWTATEDGCLTVVERVLIERSATPVTYADQHECVPDGGEWGERYGTRTLTRTLDARVTFLVPPAVVHAAGGWNWNRDTRAAYAADLVHPAVHAIVGADVEHNPDRATPADWRPADPASWCAYAVDWIAVKTRWELTVTDAERTALDEMLTSCDEPGSAGPDLATTVLGEPLRPAIGLLLPGASSN